MLFPRQGDRVAVKIGGDCGVVIRGRVSHLLLEEGRHGMMLQNRQGDEVIVFFEELDKLKIEGKKAG